MKAKVTTKVKKIRRPGVAILADKLQRQNPAWSKEDCIGEAKARITSTYRGRVRA